MAQRAKIVLNIHRREGARYFAWHRAVLHGIAQGALLLSEPVENASPFRAGRDFIEAELPDFPAVIGRLLDSESGRRRAARVARRGRRTFLTHCRLDRWLVPAMEALGSVQEAAALPERLRAEAAAELLRQAAV